MVQFDVKNAKGLAALDKHLLNNSFVEGFALSGADAALYAQVSFDAVAAYPSVRRWHKLIGAFSDKERAAWPGAAKAPAPAAEEKKTEEPKKEPKKNKSGSSSRASSKSPSPKKPPKKDEKKKKDDDDFGFSDDDEDDDGGAAALIAKKKKEQEEKAKADAVAKSGKSSVIWDIKPWGLETDLAEMEKLVRAIEIEGLRWAGSQLEEVAYGIRKLRINSVVVDELVSIDLLQEKIEALEDHVQSCDIYAFNKL
jgi:translation elongation factor EF-1beta